MCELFDRCPLDASSDLDNLCRSIYCEGACSSCARYIVQKELGYLPEDLRPFEFVRAQQLVASRVEAA